MSYITLEDVKCQIDKNHEFIQEMEALIPLQKTDNEKLELLSLIGTMYSEYITGVYASEKLERYISDIGEKIKFSTRKQSQRNKNLIVMSKAEYIGGHTVLVHNWIKWDDKNQYTVVFTNMSRLDVPSFIEDIVQVSGGKIVCLQGNFIEKASKLLEISQGFERVILFSHMNDIVPVLAYSNKNWTIPVYFYNHADFRFSYGFSVSDVVLNLGQFDIDKTVRFRGVAENKSIYFQFPGQGKFSRKDSRIDKSEVRNIVNKKYGLRKQDKLIVSMGADFKYENIIGYEFDSYVKELLKRSEKESSFLIIGADKKRQKWIDLEKNTNGKAKVLGILPRDEAEELITAADLYIVSFPMLSSGRGMADSVKVPSLCLNIIGRSVDKNDIRTANSIEELIEKSLDVLSGNGDKYLHMPALKSWNQEEWKNRWNGICEKFDYHELQMFAPQRHIEKQEYVNCQLMQKSASRAVYNYINAHQLSTQIREKLFSLDQKYGMGIFQEDIYGGYNDIIGVSDKYLKLYQTTVKWLRLKQENKKIDKYLYEKGYHTIAVYGMSYMGQTLVDELLNSLVEVLYGIDQNAGGLHSKIKIYKPTDKLEPVDLILNTTNIENFRILEGMKEKGIPMLHFDEVLDAIWEN